MLWALITIVAVAILASLNIFDKFLVVVWIKNPAVPVMFQVIVGIIASLPMILEYGLPYISFLNLVYVFVCGVSFVLMSLFYFKGLQNEEVSRAIPIFYSSTIFVVILAAFFLSEKLVSESYFGIGLLLAGALLISWGGPVRLGRPFWYMLSAAFMLAVYMVTTKYLLNYADVWSVFAFTRLATGVSLPFLMFGIGDLTSTVRRHGMKAAVAMSLDEGLSLLGWYLITIASSLGLVTLVNALSSTQPLFVFAMASIVSYYFPGIFNEKQSIQSVTVKLIAITMIFAGTIIVLAH